MCRAEMVGEMQHELVERARAGDHEAFSILARRAFPRLHGTASLILRDRDRAQDAVQDALVLAWRHSAAIRDADAWDAWLYRTTVRACYRLAQRERRRQLLELPVPEDWDPGVPDTTIQAERRDLLGRELDRLSLDQRVVVVLHFYLDLPFGEIAEILGVPIGTAKSRLGRALQTLRTSMDRERSLTLALEGPA